MMLTEQEKQMKQIILKETFEDLKNCKNFSLKIQDTKYIIFFKKNIYEIFVTNKNKCLQHRIFSNVSDFSEWYDAEVDLIVKSHSQMEKIINIYL